MNLLLTPVHHSIDFQADILNLKKSSSGNVVWDGPMDGRMKRRQYVSVLMAADGKNAFFIKQMFVFGFKFWQ